MPEQIAVLSLFVDCLEDVEVIADFAFITRKYTVNQGTAVFFF